MSKSFRETKQRNAIVETLKKHGNPMTAKHIRDVASTIVPSLGIATVYRNIRHLLDSGGIEQIDVPGVTSFYTLPRSKPQALIVCLRTRRVRLVDTDIRLKTFRQIPENFRARHMELFLFGEFTSPEPAAEPTAAPTGTPARDRIAGL